MKKITILFIIIIIQGCQINKGPNPIIGTWSKCFRDGEYREYKINKDYILMLSKKDKEISIFRNKIEVNSLIISGFGDSFIQNKDTLVILATSRNSIVLKSKFTKLKFEFSKMENQIGKVDSVNLENWKSQTMLGFQKRAKLSNCQDLRTEKEKREAKGHRKFKF